MDAKQIRKQAAPGTIDRRRAPRVQMRGQVQGHVVSVSTPIVVREMSLGGMATETSFPRDVGAFHEFHLTLRDGAHIRLRGQVRHCRQVRSHESGSALYVTGIQFADEALAESSKVLADFLDKISSR